MKLGKDEIEKIVIALAELALGIAAYALLPPPISTLAIAALLEMIKIISDHHEPQTQPGAAS